MKDIGMLIGVVLLALIVLEVASKLIGGKWFWQRQKEKKEREAKFEKIKNVISEEYKKDGYPWCSNSKHWITVEFNLRLPKTCPNWDEKECEWEKCAYFSWREETSYLKKKRELMKSYGMDIISSKNYFEHMEKEEG